MWLAERIPNRHYRLKYEVVRIDIIGKLNVGQKGKPAPNQSVMLNGLHTFQYFPVMQATPSASPPQSKASGFELTPHDGKWLQTFMDDAVKTGRLTKGVWKKRVWLNLILVSRLGRAWLEHHHQYSTWSWDTTLSRWMSVVLIASLGCRAGYVTWARLHTGSEYIQYRHIRLTLNGNGAATWESLEACVTLKYAKGIKHVQNKELEYYLNSLNDPKHQHTCPITLILIHALRHGLVRGTTIQEVLDKIARCNGCFWIVQWCRLLLHMKNTAAGWTSQPKLIKCYKV